MVENTLQVGKIAGLALSNAMIFHEILADNISDIRKLGDILNSGRIQSELSTEWTKIMKIDYDPIFRISVQILNCLPTTLESRNSLKHLVDLSLTITENKTALTTDLMGRIFHKLLKYPKYTGTYYTHVPSATLLCDLMLTTEISNLEWSNINDIAKLRIADLSCGTGTLLKSCLETISGNYVHRCAAKGVQPSLPQLHTTLLENVLYGFDIFQHCINLTASTLALHYPEVSFSNMNIYSLPYGNHKNKIRMGSLDFIESNTVKLLSNGEKHTNLVLPELDICVINPPYNRSVGQNLLFGTLPAADRRETRNKLKKIVKDLHLPANITAGLASLFIALANKYIKTDGFLAVVLPKAILSGVTWKKTRELLSKDYHIKYILSSHGKGKWNFSNESSMAEVLIVARKLSEKEKEKPLHTIFANLKTRPQNKISASLIARDIILTPPADFFSDSISYLPFDMCSEVTKVDSSFMKGPLWSYPAICIHTDLSRVMYLLTARKELYIPGNINRYPIPLIELGKIAEIGKDRREITDGFGEGKTKTTYAGFHGHREMTTNYMAQKVNGYYAPLPKARPNRRLVNAASVWALRSRLMVTERISTTTNSLVSVILNEPAIAAVWWTIRLNDSNKDFEKIVALWLNSTFGVLGLLPFAVPTSPKWISIKKDNLRLLPILDPRRLDTSDIKSLSDFYDTVCHKKFQPFSKLDSDQVRISIDNKLERILSLPSIKKIRELVVHEPSMSG